ncbi:putative CAAX prenyl protease 1 [Nosema granulosis]|uniref:CAAX prenyl protease 1 n=1 Tax=Nosema granulosis TaxID=83296 RepID=A0A9P6KWX5_9MICR|nr:putative CAAX prenyl protease 1 [Nosema granulosis]
MKKIWIYLFYTIISFTSFAVLLELISCVDFLISNKLRNDFLMNFLDTDVSEYKYKHKLNTIMLKNIWGCVFDIIVVLFCFITINIFQNLTYFDHNITKKSRTSELDGTEKDEHEQYRVSIFSKRLGRMLESGNRLLFFISFVSLFTINGDFLLSLIVGYIYWKFNVWLFKMFNIYKPMIITGSILGFFYILHNAQIESLSHVSTSERDIPGKIIDYLRNEKIKYNFIRIKEENTVNMAVLEGKNMYHFLLIGSIEIFTKNEVISVLFHEIGHIINKSLPKRKILILSISLMFVVLQTMFLKLNSKINIKNLTSPEKLFVLECIGIVFFTKVIIFTLNVFTQLDELGADSCSKSLFNPKHLATALIKLHFAYGKRFPTTFLYSLLVSTHPSLLKRLNRIGFN